MQHGEVLVEQGDRNVPFFLVVSGEVEIVRPSGGVETLITIHGPGQFTGEVNNLSGRPAVVRMRATKQGELIETGSPTHAGFGADRCGARRDPDASFPSPQG